MSDAMSDLAALDLREQLVRIDRAIADTRKLQAEAAKLKPNSWGGPFLVGFAFGSVAIAVMILLLLEHGWHP